THAMLGPRATPDDERQHDRAEHDRDDDDRPEPAELAARKIRVEQVSEELADNLRDLVEERGLGLLIDRLAQFLFGPFARLISAGKLGEADHTGGAGGCLNAGGTSGPSPAL